MKIALVTYAKFSQLTPDDQILAKYLSDQGEEVEAVCWDEPNINWKIFDLVVIRSTWDYFERPEEFKAWLTRLQFIHAPVMNPLPVIAWNLDKNYFDLFAANGVTIPPYVILKKDANASLHSILELHGWTKAVVKPTIAGGAYKTWMTTGEHADQPQLEELLKHGDVIVQKFVDNILSNGEVSLIYFNKNFSHAILKRPTEGDFRVQSQYGGSITPYSPDDRLLRLGGDILDSIPDDLLYARVDGVVCDDGSFLLMEVELIEPNLFFEYNANATLNFYQALKEIQV